LLSIGFSSPAYSYDSRDCWDGYVKALETDQNYENAIKICKPLAQNGGTWAQATMTSIYYYTENYKEALKWGIKAAEQGDASSQLKVGLMYELGQGVLKNYKEAVKWYRKSAEQDNVAALNNMGLMYELGRGVLKNYQVSANWYSRAADEGSATAQMNLGIYYCEGSGVKKDLSIAKRLLLMAYESGKLSSGQQGMVERIWERCNLANY